MPIFKRRSISSLGAKKKEMPEGLWHNCPECKAIIHEVDMKQRFRVCPKCDYHFTMTSGERIEMLVDPGSFVEIDARLLPIADVEFGVGLLHGCLHPLPSASAGPRLNRDRRPAILGA